MEKMSSKNYSDIKGKLEKSAWEKNVVMLHAAVKHLSDNNKLWNSVRGCLPASQPETGKEKVLCGLEAIFYIRDYISHSLGGFAAVQEDMFRWTENYEKTHASPGYTDDGFDYRKKGTDELTMKWYSASGECAGSFQTFPISKREATLLCNHITIGRSYNKYHYINGVDHFYTNLLWLISSGLVSGSDEGKDAFQKASTPGLLYSVADILKCKPDSFNMSCGDLKVLLRAPYDEMLKPLTSMNI